MSRNSLRLPPPERDPPLRRGDEVGGARVDVAPGSWPLAEWGTGSHTARRVRPSPAAQRRRPGRAAALALEPERVRRRAPARAARSRPSCAPRSGPPSAGNRQPWVFFVCEPGTVDARPAGGHAEPRQLGLGAAGLGGVRDGCPRPRGRGGGRRVGERLRALRRRPGRGPRDAAGPGDGTAHPPVRRLRPRRPRRGARRTCHAPLLTGIAVGIPGDADEVDERTAARDHRDRVRADLSGWVFGGRFGEAWVRAGLADSSP